jgi:uncharacterized integral membrane protein
MAADLPESSASKPRATVRKDRSKQLAAAILGGVVAVFAALNLDEVEVNWILGTWSTPLVIVIALSFLLGAAGGYLVAGRRAKRRT